MYSPSGFSTIVMMRQIDTMGKKAKLRYVVPRNLLFSCLGLTQTRFCDVPLTTTLRALTYASDAVQRGAGAFPYLHVVAVEGSLQLFDCRIAYLD